MNIYKTALSALIIAPIIGGVSIQLIRQYQSTREQAERYASEAEQQMEQVMAMLGESPDDIMDEAAIYADEDCVYDDVEQAVIRFHIRANSDSEEDQALKLKVRDAVLAYLSPELMGAESKEDARNIIEAHLSELEAIGQATIREEGYDYEIHAHMTQEEFPIKCYGDLMFPAGEYEALRIDIGTSEGGNWWCVMYPGLCFVDTVGGVVATDGKEELQHVLTEEEYENLLMSPEEDVELEYHSYLVDSIRSLFKDTP